MEVELFNSFKSRLMSFVFDFAFWSFLIQKMKGKHEKQKRAEKKMCIKPANEGKFIILAKLINPKSVLWDFMAPSFTAWAKAANYVFNNKICKLRLSAISLCLSLSLSHIHSVVKTEQENFFHSLWTSSMRIILISFFEHDLFSFPHTHCAFETQQELPFKSLVKNQFALSRSLADELGNCSDY